MIQLEKYRGTKSRHTCPACHHKNEFTRFVDDAGRYIDDNVGICNRALKCGYLYTAKQFFADNPTFQKLAQVGVKKRNIRSNRTRQSTRDAESASLDTFTNVCIKTQNPNFDISIFDFIAPEHLKATLGNRERNNFVKFLFDLFPDCIDEIHTVLNMYFVGTFQDYRGSYTCFPCIDRLNRICKAKLIRFNQTTGKRLKGEFDTSSLPAKLKLKEDFNYKQIFFGEHLLPKYPNKPIAIVEAEKTAIIASLCLPEKLWLASGSKQWLKAERLKRLGDRQVILYPDADGFDRWQKIAADAQGKGQAVKVSSLIENHATIEQKEKGYDLADYLISQQNEINQFNKYVDDYNSRLKAVLNDETLKNQFNTILEEQKAVMTIDGNLPETEAETLLSDPINIRRTVMSL